MRQFDNKLTAMGESVREKFFPQLEGIRIAWLLSDEEKKNNGKIVHADCTKASAKYDWCCDYDFFITVYAPNVAHFTSEQMDILLEHELMHVGITDTGTFRIVPHDAEEFMDIIRKYGIDWDK